jgi:hypothetical protein
MTGAAGVAQHRGRHVEDRLPVALTLTARLTVTAFTPAGAGQLRADVPAGDAPALLQAQRALGQHPGVVAPNDPLAAVAEAVGVATVGFAAPAGTGSDGCPDRWSHSGDRSAIAAVRPTNECGALVAGNWRRCDGDGDHSHR